MLQVFKSEVAYKEANLGIRNGKPYRYYHEFKRWCFSILGDRCHKCGTQQDLEIDHIVPTEKEFEITKKWSSKSLAELKLELAKCQILCKGCHLEKSIPELKEAGLAQGKTHGTKYVALKLKCKCETCLNTKKEWHILRNAKRRGESSVRGPYNLPAEHGTFISYKRGCKCLLCKKANADKVRKYKQRIASR